MTPSGAQREKFGTCGLCREDRERCESHIYPQFIFDWFKKTSGSPDLRGAEEPNRILQDGPKPYALCFDCEQKFSKGERWFASNVFHPYIRNAVVPKRQYDAQLFYFLVSLAWRMLVLAEAIKDTSLPNHDLLQAAEQEWRDYLFSENKTPQTYNTFHMVLANPDDAHNFPVKQLRDLDNFNRWFKRYIDGTVVSWEGRTMLFLKLPAVLIFVPITPHDGRYLEGTAVAVADGRIPKRQRIKDNWLISILAQRAQSADRQISALSDKQVQRNLKSILKHPEADRSEQLMKDVKAASARIRKATRDL